MVTRIYAPNRISEIRKARDLTLQELVGRMQADIDPSTLSKLEKRKMALSLDYLLDIASVLEVSPMEIIGGERVGSGRAIPVAGRISAGNWQEAVQMTDEFMSVPGHLAGPNLFILYPRGDSMDMLVREGGYIVVDPDDRELIDKKYYVVMNGEGETTFKQFSANPMQLLPCSTNPNHKPIPLGSEPFTILARVVHVGQDV